MIKVDNETVDVVCYLGQVSTQGYMDLSEAIEHHGNKNATSVFFIPVTNGGDPNAGYRIARALGHYYPKAVSIGIPSVCKSAGTLMCIGGSELVIADRGELGPLDIQLNSKDELFGMSSGLDIMQALTALQDTMNSAFKNYLYDLKFGGRLGTKMASDIASNMAIGLITPIAQQIDPVKLGEHQRAMQIAIAYGERLNNKFKNTSREKIERLLTSYPAHGFVIDRKEVSELFNKVRSPSEKESKIFKFLDSLAPGYGVDVASSLPKCWVSGMNRLIEMADQQFREKDKVPTEVSNESATEFGGGLNDSQTAEGVARDSTSKSKRKRREQGGNE